MHIVTADKVNQFIKRYTDRVVMRRQPEIVHPYKNIEGRSRFHCLEPSDPNPKNAGAPKAEKPLSEYLPTEGVVAVPRKRWPSYDPK